jgi:hypothetical protein
MGVQTMLNVQTEENRWNADNAYVTGVDELEFMPRLDDSTLYSTVYLNDRPIATLQRRSALDYGRGPAWKLYDIDASLVRQWHFAPTYRALARGVFLALERAGKVAR